MAGPTVAAMVVEPVLGEGGYIVPPVAWLEGLRDRCDEIGALLIFDEVQCGMGRTGRPFAAETFGVRPDVLLFAKGVASGLPLGGIVAERVAVSPSGRRRLTGRRSAAIRWRARRPWPPSTCSRRAASGTGPRPVGRQIMSQLREACRGNSAVVDIRGIGLMIGIELVSGEVAADVQRRCFDAGALLLVCGTHDQVIRLVPPLTISDDEIALGIEILSTALREVATVIGRR